MNNAAITLPIETERLCLRQFNLDDADDLYAIFSRPDVVAYLYGEERTLSDVQQLVERRTEQGTRLGEGESLVLAMTQREGAESRRPVLGQVTLQLRSIEHMQGEIGYVLHPAFHGKGFAREAAAAMLDLAFGTLAWHRVYARADERNAASLAVMRRLGMREEAHFRENEWFKGEWGSEYIYAMLRSEWAEQKSP